jgi:hypothetical protein
MSSGELGGGDYDYLVGYVWIRPTATTFLSASSERLSNFGDFDQTIVVARWDISSRQAIGGRYVTGDFGEAYRLAYALNLRKNLDFFLVYEHEPVQLETLSAKILLTLQ